MRLRTRGIFALCALLACRAGASGPDTPATYRGVPFHDGVYTSGPQRIPGRVQCAYFDLGGEGVAYHNSDTINHGSGRLNPANGTYLNEFRMNEAVGTSYTKFHDAIDNSAFNIVVPTEGQLYVGWTSPGEWFNLTVDVARTGTYAMDLLYTSNRGGDISVGVMGAPGAAVVHVISTRNPSDPVAWRQWHHWNLMKDIGTVRLAQGINVLTVRILTEGNMNLAALDFRERK
jgi:hypothetical protein